jgi:hypothetical protein
MFQDDDGLVPLPLNTIRIAYTELCRHVDITLRVQIGDAVMMREAKHDCLRFLTTVDQVRWLYV